MFYRPHKRVTFHSGDKLITKQSHKAECDIHTILRQYQRTGILTHVAKARADYTDLPDPMDYQESLHVLQQGEAAFAALPAAVRSHFDNDPLKFLMSFNDEAQHPKLREFGLINPLPPSPTNTPPEG